MIIGLDVGGTHTDVVLLGNNGLEKQTKVLTDPEDLYKSVLAGLEKITADIDPQQIHRIVLSTTLTTNAIVQERTPAVGMIVSGGPGIDPEVYRTNNHYCAVSGSIDHRGREIEPIDLDEIHDIGRRFQEAGVQYVGVVGKFSIRNPIHELSIKDALNNRFDKIFMGHKISGSLNFARRIATTYLNAAVYPIHKDFFEAEKNLASGHFLFCVALRRGCRRRTAHHEARRPTEQREELPNQGPGGDISWQLACTPGGPRSRAGSPR